VGEFPQALAADDPKPLATSARPGRPRIPGFTSAGANNWLQGRCLVPLLCEYSARIDGTILDLGCGKSPFRPLFNAARKFIRIDCYPVDPEVIVADATALPLEDGSVDCILLAQVIGDVADLPKLFRELARVLAPGGSVLVYETISYFQHDLPHDCWRVLPAGLTWAGEQAGLTTERVAYLGGYGTQLGMNWNFLVSSLFDRVFVTRPIGWLLRAAGNLVFAGLDAIAPRPTLATDYFACLTRAKPQRTHEVMAGEHNDRHLDRDRSEL
jgi:SAM-dependent methyltransferase